MKFEYYNPSDESGSCVVRTMTKLTGKEYDIVKTELTALAKILRCETYNDENVFGQYMADHDIYKIKECNNTTVGELELNDGIYCIYSTNQNGFFHLIPVIDNVIYDRRNDSLQMYVIAIYKKEDNKNTVANVTSLIKSIDRCEDIVNELARPFEEG